MEHGLSGGGSLERELTGAGAFLSRLGLYGAWALLGVGSLGRGLSGARSLWSGTLFSANFALFEIDLSSTNDSKKSLR